MWKKISVIFLITLLLTTAIPVSSTFIKIDSQDFKTQSLSVDEKSIDSRIEFLMEIGHFPSVSTCIIKKDNVVWSNGYGFSDMDNNIIATDETVYQIASVTKTVTGTALMQLYDLDFFDLDNDINDFLPFELRNPNFPDISITFRMLLAHSSSLQNTNGYWYVNFLQEGPPFENYPSPWLEEYLLPGGSKYEVSVWSDIYEPGERSYYANINYDLIAYLVEIISGEPFYEYCEKHIFEPLDMKKTSFRLTDYDPKEVAIPYFYNPFTNNHEKNKNFVFIHYPAGGLFTTVSDLSHFLIAHMNGGVYKDTRILSEISVEEMHSIQPPGNKFGFYFGLGWLIMSRSLWIGFQYPVFNVVYFPKSIYSGHGGDISYGLHTRMNMKLSGDIGVIFFINTHRTHRSGWNCAELLNELLFSEAQKFEDEDLKTDNVNKNLKVYFQNISPVSIVGNKDIISKQFI
jgi:CubicO group peptidase (beta-lactamase class C family)